MSLALAIAVYFVCWWLVLIMVLPIGVKTQGEAGHVEPGTPESAPSAPHLLLKLAATTAVTAALVTGIYWATNSETVFFDRVPFLPRFEDLSQPTP